VERVSIITGNKIKFFNLGYTFIFCLGLVAFSTQKANHFSNSDASLFAIQIPFEKGYLSISIKGSSFHVDFPIDRKTDITFNSLGEVSSVNVFHKKTIIKLNLKGYIDAISIMSPNAKTLHDSKGRIKWIGDSEVMYDSKGRIKWIGDYQITYKSNGDLNSSSGLGMC